MKTRNIRPFRRGEGGPGGGPGDETDFTTPDGLFQDIEGTIPVTEPGQPVGSTADGWRSEANDVSRPIWNGEGITVEGATNVKFYKPFRMLGDGFMEITGKNLNGTYFSYSSTNAVSSQNDNRSFYVRSASSSRFEGIGGTFSQRQQKYEARPADWATEFYTFRCEVVNGALTSTLNGVEFSEMGNAGAQPSMRLYSHRAQLFSMWNRDTGGYTQYATTGTISSVVLPSEEYVPSPYETDFTDMSILFQDIEGTIPVTDTGQPVGSTADGWQAPANDDSRPVYVGEGIAWQGAGGRVDFIAKRHPLSGPRDLEVEVDYEWTSNPIRPAFTLTREGVASRGEAGTLYIGGESSNRIVAQTGETAGPPQIISVPYNSFEFSFGPQLCVTGVREGQVYASHKGVPFETVDQAGPAVAGLDVDYITLGAELIDGGGYNANERILVMRVKLPEPDPPPPDESIDLTDPTNLFQNIDFTNPVTADGQEVRSMVGGWQVLDETRPATYEEGRGVRFDPPNSGMTRPYLYEGPDLDASITYRFNDDIAPQGGGVMSFVDNRYSYTDRSVSAIGINNQSAAVEWRNGIVNARQQFTEPYPAGRPLVLNTIITDGQAAPLLNSTAMTYSGNTPSNPIDLQIDRLSLATTWQNGGFTANGRITVSEIILPAENRDAPPLSAPVFEATPNITGDAEVGASLRLNAGYAYGNPMPVDADRIVTWFADADEVQNTNNTNYTVQEADAGKTITCYIRQTNSEGFVEATTNGIEIPAGDVFRYETGPDIGGVIEAGQFVTCDYTLANGTLDFAEHQWAINGATVYTDGTSLPPPQSQFYISQWMVGQQLECLPLLIAAEGGFLAEETGGPVTVQAASSIPDLLTSNWAPIQSPRDDLLTQNGTLWTLERADGQSDPYAGSEVAVLEEGRDYAARFHITAGDRTDNFFRLRVGTTNGGNQLLQMPVATQNNYPTTYLGAFRAPAEPVFMSYRSGGSAGETMTFDDAETHIVPLEFYNLLGVDGNFDDYNQYRQFLNANAVIEDGKLKSSMTGTGDVVSFRDQDYLTEGRIFRVTYRISSWTSGNHGVQIEVGSLDGLMVSGTGEGLFTNISDPIPATGSTTRDIVVVSWNGGGQWEMDWILVEDVTDNPVALAVADEGDE